MEGRGMHEERVCGFSWLAGTCTETSLHPDGWAKRAGCLCLGGENLGLLLTLLPGNNHALSPPTGVMSGEIRGNTFAKHKNRHSISHTCTLKHMLKETPASPGVFSINVFFCFPHIRFIRIPDLNLAASLNALNSPFLK